MGKKRNWRVVAPKGRRKYPRALACITTRRTQVKTGLVIPSSANFGCFRLDKTPISGERERGSLDLGGSWVFWSRKACELGRVFSEDFEAELPQLLLGHGQPHIKDLEHLELYLSNVSATRVHPNLNIHG